MRVFKSTFTDRRSGKQRSTARFYAEFRDAAGQVRRVAAFTTKAQSEELGRKIEQLVACRVAGSPPDPVLTRWLDSLPGKLRGKLAELGLLDARQVAAAKPLAAHADDFKSYLIAKGNTSAYVDLAVGRVRRIIDGCRFRFLADVSGSRVMAYLTGLRTDKPKIAAQTFNFYLTAFKGFCQWLVRDGRASASPVEYLQGLNVRTDRRHDRRPLTVEEMIWLLDVTENGSTLGMVPGPERALLYRVAAETGLRAGELRSLTTGSFELASTPPTVKVLAGHSKHRSEDVGVLKRATAELLAKHLAGKMPNVPALRMPGRRMLPVVLKKDLALARQQWLDSAPDAKTRTEMEKTDFLAYKDRDGRYADFHALRHVTGSYLARASVSPKVAQSILRHSDINLTMNFYSHAFREDQVHAVEGLPDLSARPARPKKDVAG